MYEENRQVSFAFWMPAWTAAGDSAAGSRLMIAGSTSVPKVKHALISLQNRSIVRFGTLRLVWHLLLITIGSVAYELLA